ncbi:multidrug resistance-associated protein 1-like [Periophthalmus magnuspinnatus]|uniref:multidrug resistance-associated protein 1-like n=1 Tax=Periophthalmus magnuspinnatus TaxID=409849 RepID=UPI002436FF34|nr:multidrug resistance-associated protein 1-like [Periophthalmus magnuspinnatus]
MEAVCKLSGLDPLWDWNLTWYTERPDLTQCFQQTVLVWAPCIYLWTCSPFYLLYLLLHAPGPRLPLSSFCCVKTALAVILLCCCLVELLYIYALKEETHRNVVFLLGPLLHIISLDLTQTPNQALNQTFTQISNQAFQQDSQPGPQPDSQPGPRPGPPTRIQPGLQPGPHDPDEECCGWQVLAVCVIQVERLKGVCSSILLFLFWLLTVLCSVVPLKVAVEQIIHQVKQTQRHTDRAVDLYCRLQQYSQVKGSVQQNSKQSLSFSSDPVRFTVLFLEVLLQFVQMLLSCFSDPPPMSKTRPALRRCPEESASFLSQFFFFWFSSLVLKGCCCPLKAVDLWALRHQDTSAQIMQEVELMWAKGHQETRYEHNAVCDSLLCSAGLEACGGLSEKSRLLQPEEQRQNLSWLLLRTTGRSFGLYFLCGTVCLLLHDVAMFTVPQVLSLLLEFMHDSSSPVWKGILFAVLLFLLSCVQSLLFHQYMYHCFTVGMRLKTALTGLLYRKCLVMSSGARRQCAAGEVISLVSADVQKLMDLVVYINSIWTAPLEIALCFYFLCLLLGPSALAGLSVVLLLFPLNGFITTVRTKLQEVQLSFMDGRIKAMTEMVSGMKILKFYAWEEVFQRQVEALREGELSALRRSQILYCVSLASFTSSSFLVMLTVFGVYVLMDQRNVLDAQKIFVSAALINILKTPLSQLLFAISTAAQALVSLKRITNFLQQDKVKEDSVRRLAYSADCALSILSTDAPAVEVHAGYFSWSTDSPPSLSSINVMVEQGALVAVVGPVGSGKSSLLAAVLGEMERRSGSLSTRGSVALVPQQAWTLNASVKENILFGAPRSEGWYHRVLEACALLPDLDLLPAGDSSEIGEKGVNLSGGQRQRISLARAVYRKSDIYLLDDPLSAVDAHVGQHIFDRVIGPNGLLRDKTRILVTHGASLLPQCDVVLVLEEGHISESGSFSQLMERQGAFAKFIQMFGVRPQKTDVQARERGSRRTRSRSLSRLSMTEFSTDLSQEQQLLSCDLSSASTQPLLDFAPEDPGKLTEMDRPHTGRVRLQTYKEYFETIGLAFLLLIVLLYAFQQGASLSFNYWLSMWADDPPVNGSQTDHDLRLGVFATLGLMQGLAMFATTLAISLGGITASRHLHGDLLQNVLRSPMVFFESTPSGSLLNRFSKEIDAIDCMIPDGLKMMLGYLLKLLEVCIIVLLATPLIGLVLLPLAVLYVLFQRFYVVCSCQLRRLEAVSRSPIYTHLNQSVQGAVVIRAFREQERFIQSANQHIDTNQEAYYPRFVATRWLAVNLEFLGNVLVLASALFSVLGRHELSSGIVGLAISHSLQVTGVLSWIVRSWTDVENNIVSVERVKEYAHTPKEAPWRSELGALSPLWPSSGSISFEDFGLQYRQGLDWALKDIDFHIQDGEKIGIVGRTGAGKSSLALGLFRILEAANGRICIDGTDISLIGLHDLRSRLTIIPQDPVLFSGTVRMNLDPYETCSDSALWDVLQLSHLTTFVSNLPNKLNHMCSEGGEDLSVGQRQLLCLARALLRKSRVLVLDEATAAVDLETDRLIQSTIRTHFRECTVLTIAHRLNTILDYSRVVVMDQGSVVEMAPPAVLLQQRGHFYRMCVEAGLV